MIINNNKKAEIERIELHRLMGEAPWSVSYRFVVTFTNLKEREVYPLENDKVWLKEMCRFVNERCSIFGLPTLKRISVESVYGGVLTLSIDSDKHSDEFEAAASERLPWMMIGKSASFPDYDMFALLYTAAGSRVIQLTNELVKGEEVADSDESSSEEGDEEQGEVEGSEEEVAEGDEEQGEVEGSEESEEEVAEGDEVEGSEKSDEEVAEGDEVEGSEDSEQSEVEGSEESDGEVVEGSEEEQSESNSSDD